MKGIIGIGGFLSVTRRTSLVLQSSFSTSSSGFGGGGRGRGGGASPSSPFFDFTQAPGKPDSDVSKQPRDLAESPPIGLGHDRGSGRPLSADPIPHSFPSFVSQNESGRGRVTPESVPPPKKPPSPQPNLEEAAKKALGMLSRSEREESGMARGGGGRGEGRGRGRGRGVDEGRGRKQRIEEKILAEPDEGVGDGVYWGNPDDEEKFAKAVGPENMSKLAEALEEMSGRVFPSPMDDALVDAFHTNCSIECEPEYLMGDFETNPDIDDKPPIPLQDALEKVKPFLMAYEGIQSQEEWEEVMKETMEKRVPLLQEIVDYYSGSDRVTAKKQQEELERVAKTIPQSAPTSVKRYANRAVLSLQSNPGWGFDKKYQFMDKLVREVSQQFK